MFTTTVKALMTHVSPTLDISAKCRNKITVIGAGTVGTAIAFCLLAQKVTDELVLIDQNEELARGEMLDMQHATMYLDSPNITSSTNYEDSKNSRICIITAGTGPERNKIALVTRNTEIFKAVIPQVVTYSPNSILLIVTNPVDILTYVAWKLSDFPPHRVIGSGTILESARFRYLLAQKLGVSTSSLHAFVIGEQGGNSIPVWSGVSVSGVRLRDINRDLGTEHDPEDWTDIHRQVVESESEIERLKSCGSWGIALSVARVVKAILCDTKECFPISTHIKGCRHGVDKDVFLSLPCVLGCQGVCYIVRQNLNNKEKELLQQCANEMNELQKKLMLE
ncbi:hypothetical protein ILUMI_09881 [Ignelater luminosus]|uniref:L-lactate dehydrogenase n=1 Tax=Ignelater luminosus TaxID=2038154 RepID=A0A8K0GEN1_IGNLU|nr:hypothetical protein ILUMI_09881 [Ignelater luminosus]